MRFKSFVLLLGFFLPILGYSQYEGAEYMEGWLNIKVNQELRDLCENDKIDEPQIIKLFEKLEVDLVKRKFPNAEPIIKSRAVSSDFPDKRVDISLIYEIHFTAEISAPKAALILENSDLFVYAEPRYIQKPLMIPNDNLIDSMWHLPIIKAFDAWDIDTGSSDVTIAIVDTGVDWDHPDMAEGIKINDIELNGVEGFDDDNNGYIDDIRGWNFYNDNNDPNELGFSHGTHVAGLAGARVNNGIGVAGTGWSCKILPVKAGDKLQIPYGYESVVYAADNGADVINCSWGSFGQSDFGHDIMRYATYNHDAVVLGGAGNDNRENRFYPASYPEVISVGASDPLDQKADFSNYNYDIDIIAPGLKIFSLKNNEYGFDSGTSMSSPIAAGVAGLLRSKYPTLNALQIMEQLRVTADQSIYDIPFNQQYEGKLGTGRLDMLKALSGINSPALRIDQELITDNDDDVLTLSEDFYVSVELMNYLNSIQDLTVTIESEASNVEVLSGTWNVSSIPTGGSADNFSQPFSLRVNALYGYDQKVVLKLTASSSVNNYEFVGYLTAVVNPSFVNVTVNRINTTVNQNGLFGFTDFYQTNGLGFELDTFGNLLYEGGLMIGFKSENRTKVVDRVRNGDLFDRDFWQESVISRQVPSGDEAFFAQGSFTDTSAITDEIGLLIDQNVYAYTEEGHENYVILEYIIENRSHQDLENITAGIFADWDINDATLNKGMTAFGKRLGYVYSTDGKELTAGIQALTNAPFNVYMIDNVGGGNGGINMFDSLGYSSDDKYQSLTQERLSAGDGENGNDVIQVTSITGLDIPIGSTKLVAFAVHAAESIDELLVSADSAIRKYNGYLPGSNLIVPFEVNGIYPNPGSSNFNLALDVKDAGVFSVSLLNSLGRIVFDESTSKIYEGSNELRLTFPILESGVYFLQLEKDDFTRIFPIIIQRQ